MRGLVAVQCKADKELSASETGSKYPSLVVDCSPLSARCRRPEKCARGFV